VEGTVLWVPVLPDDSVDAAELRVVASPDPRINHVWDSSGEVNPRFARSLSLRGPGWDLYLIYDRGVFWEEDLPPAPTFWMHQLSSEVGADPALFLSRDPNRLGRVLEELLADHA
jgi:hypothetical protein